MFNNNIRETFFLLERDAQGSFNVKGTTKADNKQHAALLWGKEVKDDMLIACRGKAFMVSGSSFIPLKDILIKLTLAVRTTNIGEMLV